MITDELIPNDHLLQDHHLQLRGYWERLWRARTAEDESGLEASEDEKIVHFWEAIYRQSVDVELGNAAGKAAKLKYQFDLEESPSFKVWIPQTNLIRAETDRMDFESL